MKTFVSSTGVSVDFRCRDAPKEYFDIWNRGQYGSKREIVQDTDTGELRLMFGDPIPDEWRVAMVEYRANQQREYEAWRAKNAHLFV